MPLSPHLIPELESHAVIVKVPLQLRKDGRSSITDLKAYITHGIEQSGDSTDKGSWDRLTQYITKESVLNALGTEVEKTIGVEIGNVASLDTTAEEMRIVASYNKRVDNPTLHYILSWPEREVPKLKEIFEAARASLKSLGMADHQYIIAIHGNTDNIHAHIAVNRVHPRTYKAARIEWLHKTLHRAAREIEIEHGWSHDNGLFKVVEINGKKYVVPNTEYVDPDLENVKGGAAEFETWHGKQSLETWCRGQPAEELRKLIGIQATNDWQQVHQVLAKFGLELRDSGGGGMRVHVLTDDAAGSADKPLSVSASKAFRFKRAELEERFGAFKPAEKSVSQSQQQVQSYKRDPHKRLERKLERRALRDALYKRFLDEQKIAREQRDLATIAIKETFVSSDASRRAALQNAYRLQRAAIKADTSLAGAAKQQAYMLVKLTMMQARTQLEDQIKRERAERRSLLPALLAWREWVETQALTGDEAAISALRGMVYQEGRNRKKTAAGAAEEVKEDAIFPTNPAITDPFVRKVQNLVWKVHRNGNVAYNFKTGESGFVDAGERLLFDRAVVSDEALALTLQYAYDKWGGALNIKGGDVNFKIRAAKLAAELGITLSDPSTKNIQRAHISRRSSVATAPTVDNDKALNQQLREQFPGAAIEHAVTRSSKYVGKIIAENQKYIVQVTALGKYILHERQVLGTNLLNVGDHVTIAYKSGFTTLKVTKGRIR